MKKTLRTLLIMALCVIMALSSSLVLAESAKAPEFVKLTWYTYHGNSIYKSSQIR